MILENFLLRDFGQEKRPIWKLHMLKQKDPLLCVLVEITGWQSWLSVIAKCLFLWNKGNSDFITLMYKYNLHFF